MRLVFMGTPEFAAPTLQRLLESDHEVAAAISQPDRPAGRGQRVRPTPVKECAQAAGVPMHQPEKVKTREFYELIEALEPELIVVVAYGRILPEPILSLPRHGCWNVHASLLPKYRGAAPIQWAMIEGERETGVTLMQLDAGMDTGDILRQQRVDILDDDDALSLSQMLSIVGAQLLLDTVDELAREGHVEATPQDHELATHAPLLAKEDGCIDWTLEPEAVICRIQGLKPWPGAYAVGPGGSYKLHRAISFYPDEAEAFLRHDQQPGEIIAFIDGSGPVVRAGESCLCLTEFQPPNRKAMSGQDAINGGYVKVGICFE